MSGLRRRLRVSAVLLTATALFAAGCGGGGSDKSSANAGGLEKTELNIGMLPLPETAPIQIAIDKGFFKAEGLTVTKPTIIAGGAAGMADLLSGKLDVMHSNYVSAITTAATGVGKIKVVGEAWTAKPGNFALMVKKGSPIKSVADFKGKTVAVNTFKNVAELAMLSLLKTNGLTPEDVTFKEMPFPQMQGGLATNQMDVAFMPEPFYQTAASKDGAVLVAEPFAGPTADFPIAGYLVTEDFAKKNPKTVAAFQRALVKATEVAISNSAEVEAALPKYTKIDRATAELMVLGGFSTTVNATRLQRVADLMTDFKYLPSKFDASSMIYSGSAS
ncbi:ABC transporter substrate-binding protein [Nonomuraea rhodomycinica]|uniref:ABC transporter substrate-binding protein n=1 Tax=Nonomuraea rhodomycinica TaxID=1712872 RepID=A0A7Y6MHT0_9ACTN|nr:ABC transporter substrate-binding protein [Nonomuraea rhodomycinica]NUW47056.1 ABC transporter substrate-binding protein [Nonomuraea rhodomycinica]